MAENVDLTVFEDEFPGGNIVLYVHYIDEENPKLSLTVKHVSSVKSPKTVGDLLEEFLSLYGEKFSLGLPRHRAVISNGIDEIKNSRYLPVCFENMADVFLKINEEKKEGSMESKSSYKAKSKAQKTERKRIAKDKKRFPEKKLVAKFQEGMKQQQSGLLKKAYEIFHRVSKKCESFPEHPIANQLLNICLEAMGSIHLANKKFREAEKIFSRVPEEKRSLRGWFFLGRSYFGIKNYKEAVRCFGNAKEKVGKGQDAKETTWDIDVWIGRSVYKSKPTSNLPIEIFEKVLKESPQHAMATLQYAQVAVDRGRGSDALGHILQTLIHCSQTLKNKVDGDTVKLAQRLFAQVIAAPGMVDILLRTIASAAQSPPALGYLANVAKENGVIGGCSELLSRAIAISSIKEGSLLNLSLSLVHAEEISMNYQKAFDICKSILAKTPEVKVRGVSHRDIFKIISKITKVDHPSLLQGSSHECVGWEPIGTLEDQGKCQVNVPHLNKETKTDLGSCRCTYSALELDSIGLCFAMVKLMYTAGCLQPLPKLINLLLPLRVNQDLHLTTIRNEHAYFTCISHVLKRFKAPLTERKERKVIYFCADSHAMAPAWQTLELKGVEYVIKPMVVTGLKCWHLRAESRFYTKVNFENAVENIPDNSLVIFGFGEIDCREGLLIAVAQNKYPNLNKVENSLTPTQTSKHTNIQTSKHRNRNATCTTN
ncbi:hypothetical protein AAMO2058_001255000 [Amorphochlora amoebiformis]